MSILGWLVFSFCPHYLVGRRQRAWVLQQKSFVFSTFSPIPIPRVKVWIGLILPTPTKHLPPKTTFMTTNKQASTQGNAPPKKEPNENCYHYIKQGRCIFYSLPLKPGASQLISQTIHPNQIFSIVTPHNIRLFGSPIGILGALTRSQRHD